MEPTEYIKLREKEKKQKADKEELMGLLARTFGMTLGRIEDEQKRSEIKGEIDWLIGKMQKEYTIERNVPRGTIKKKQ